MPSIRLLLAAAGDDGGFSRTFYEYETRDDLVKELIALFEEQLVLQKQAQGFLDEEIEYVGDDLWEFIDTFSEIVCLEHQSGTDLWIPYATSWIKECMYIYLKKQSEMTRMLDDSMEVDPSKSQPQTKSCQFPAPAYKI